MNLSVKKLEFPVQLWSMLGPLLVAFTLLIILIRGTSSEWAMPFVAIVGLLLCYQWKWRGCLGACFALFAVAGYQLMHAPSGEILWICLLALAIASSFVATRLFLEESHAIVESFKGQSETVNKTLTGLEGKVLASQNRLERETQVLTARLESLKRELIEKDETMKAQGRLTATIQEELAAAHSDKENLLEEVFQARQETTTLEVRLARLQDTTGHSYVETAEPSDSDFQKKLALQESEILELQTRLEASLEEERLVRKQLENYVLELVDLREVQQVKDLSFDKVQEEQILQKVMSDELKEHIETLSREKRLLEMTLSSLQSEFEALLIEDKNKADIIELHKTDSDTLQSMADHSAHQLKLERDRHQEFLSDSEIREKGLHQQIEELMKKHANTSQQLVEWQRKLHDYNSLNERYAFLLQQVQQHVSEKEMLSRQFEQSRRQIEQIERHLDASVSREAELRLELDEMTAEYVQANAKNLSNEHLSSFSLQLQKELSEQKNELQKHLHAQASLLQELDRLRQVEASYSQDKVRGVAEQAAFKERIDELSVKLNEAVVNLRCLKELELENQSLQEINKTHSEKIHTLLTDKTNTLPVEETSDNRESFRELRRMEGLYKQLREQFTEKARVLDETRRELFQTQEKYSSIKKELDEKEVYGETEIEQSLYHILRETETELTEQSSEYSNEILHLHGLIETLMQTEQKATH